MRNKDEDRLKLSKEQLDESAPKLKAFIETEFEFDISGLQTRMLTDFITKTMGVYYYNKGVEDSISYMTDRVDDLFTLLRD